MNYVYVQDINGKPLMPTKRYWKVRRLLDSKKAVPVMTKPFTIRLTYELETKNTQEVVLGVDPGRTNIGLAAVNEKGHCLYSAKCTTRNKEIPKLMGKRKQHRQASRRGERLARKRLAKRLGTTRKAVLERMLPGYEKPVKVKDIINTEARFNNRKRPEGWLTPTATQLLRTHMNLVRLVEKILPVSQIVLELNKFAFMAMEDPKIPAWKYEKGPLYGFTDLHSAVDALQKGKCLLCVGKIGHYHHIIPKAKGGSDTLLNIAGLCEECHDRVHKDVETAKELSVLKSGLSKKYGALSVLNQIIPELVRKLETSYPGNMSVTNGAETKAFRDEHGVLKDHNTDAYCIACSTLENPVVSIPEDLYEIYQFRRQDRTQIKAQTERTYYLDGKKVAVNRRKRMDQKEDALADFLEEQDKSFGSEVSKSVCSKLNVKKSVRRYNNLDRLMPGTVFRFGGKRYVMKGRLTNGRYLTAYGSEARFPAAKVIVVSQNKGLVYI